MAKLNDFRICVLGSEAAGKTCFFGGLGILSSADQGGSVQVRGKDQFSQQFLTGLTRTLRQQKWPQGTLQTSILRFDVSWQGNMAEFMLADYAGEQFRKAMASLDYADLQPLIEQMISAKVLLLVLDIGVDLLPAESLSIEDNVLRVERLDALLGGVMEAYRKRLQEAEPSRRPEVALILTKSDFYRKELAEHRNPISLVEQRAGQFLTKLRAWSPRVACFAVSAVGDVVLTRDEEHREILIPSDPITPQGYEDIFKWLFHVKAKPKNEKWRRRALIVFALVGLILSVRWSVYAWRNARVVEHTTSLQTVIELDGWPAGGPSSFDRAIDERVQKELSEMKAAISGDPEMSQIDELSLRGKQLWQIKHTSLGSTIQEVVGRLDQKRRNILIVQLREAVKNESDASGELAAKILKDYPTGLEADEAGTLITQFESRDREKLRALVRGIKPEGAGWLNRKADAMDRYLIKYNTDPAKDQINLAIQAARRLATQRTFNVFIEKCGTFKNSTFQQLRFEGVGFQQPLPVDSEYSATSSTWLDKKFTFNWSPGEWVKVTYVEYYHLLSNEDRAYEFSQGPLAISLLVGRHSFSNVLETGRFTFDPPFYQCRVEGYTNGDFLAINDWVFPGQKWNLK